MDVCLFRRTELSDYPAEQTVEFTQNWNWWSTYLDIDLNQLETALGFMSLKIVAQNGKFASYNVNNGTWSGTLLSLEAGKMYKIMTIQPCDIHLEGNALDPAECTIYLYNGNNWISYIGTESKALNQVFGNFTPTNMDVIRSSSGKATYYEGYGWRGSLNALEPGKGYIYKSNATTVKTFSFPSY